MDEIVVAAMAKWPNVPHCYGWLALDARGHWRMRDQRAQALGSRGDIIHNTALTEFINRNYQSDERGNWFFQNGPQRVYVDLAATPYIAKTVPHAVAPSGFLLHTGVALNMPERACLSQDGKLCLVARGVLAQVDDRDVAACLERIRLHDTAIGDETLLEWLAGAPHPLHLHAADRAAVLLSHTEIPALLAEFGIEQNPKAIT